MSVAAFAPAGLFGKLPAHGDFVRLRAGGPAARALVAWLEAGHEGAGGSAGPAPTRFLLRPAGADGAVLGVLAGSTDRVGRRFPLAVFTETAAPALGGAFPALPEGARPFLDAAAALVREAAALGQAELPARLDALPLPGAEALEGARRAAEARARATPAGEALARALGADPTQRQYALHCLRTACAAVRGRDAARAGAVLDCPAPQDVDRWLWLELARRALRWSGPPSFAWGDEPAPRLLVSLGPFPAALLGWLSGQDRPDARRWPVTASRPAALAEAAGALGPALRATLGDPRTTLAALLEAAAA